MREGQLPISQYILVHRLPPQPGFLFLFCSLILPSHHCFSLSHLPSFCFTFSLQRHRPPFFCSESLSAPQGLKVNRCEQTTTPQRVFKPVISYCEFTLVCLCSSGNNPIAFDSFLYHWIFFSSYYLLKV